MADSGARAIKTLQYAGGEIHDWQGCGEAIYEAIWQMPQLQITRSKDDLSCLEQERIAPFDLAVFYHTVTELTDAQKNGLLGWVNAGGGFVGVHSAADSFRDCPEYRAMVGGHFVTHPHYRQYMVSVVDPTHPINEGLEEFWVEDSSTSRTTTRGTTSWPPLYTRAGRHRWCGPSPGAGARSAGSLWAMTPRPAGRRSS